jgi:hypothetical protein
MDAFCARLPMFCPVAQTTGVGGHVMAARSVLVEQISEVSIQHVASLLHFRKEG